MAAPLGVFSHCDAPCWAPPGHSGGHLSAVLAWEWLLDSSRKSSQNVVRTNHEMSVSWNGTSIGPLHRTPSKKEIDQSTPLVGGFPLRYADQVCSRPEKGALAQWALGLEVSHDRATGGRGILPARPARPSPGPATNYATRRSTGGGRPGSRWSHTFGPSKRPLRSLGTVLDVLFFLVCPAFEFCNSFAFLEPWKTHGDSRTPKSGFGAFFGQVQFP